MDTTEKALQDLLSNFNQQLEVIKQQIQDANFQLSQVKGLEQRVAFLSGNAEALQVAVNNVKKHQEEYQKTKSNKAPSTPPPPAVLPKEETKKNVN